MPTKYNNKPSSKHNNGMKKSSGGSKVLVRQQGADYSSPHTIVSNRKKQTLSKSVKTKILQRYPRSLSGMSKWASDDVDDELAYIISKNSSYNSGGSGADVMRMPPDIKDPRFQQDNFFIPQTDVTAGEPNQVLNYWLLYWYRFHPHVGSIIDLHSLLPLSRFGLSGITDPSILRDYEEMCEDVQLLERMQDILKLRNLFGEAQPFLWWDDSLGRFTDMTIIDPNYIYTIGHYLLYSPEGDSTKKYELMPDEYIRAMVNSDNVVDRELIENYLDPEILSAIEQGQNLELDPFVTEMITNTAVPWHLRGCSPLEGIVKDLMYEDKLRQAQNAIASKHITPYEIWKIGDKDTPALPEDLSAFRRSLFEASNDYQTRLITHHAVQLQVEGASGRLLPLAPEFAHVENRILTRLFVTKALTTSENVPYANASVALRVLMSRYIPMRNQLENFIYRKMFLPVAIAKGYYRITRAQLSHRIRSSEKDRKPLIPIFNWRQKQSLTDDSNIKSMLMTLRAKNEIAFKVIADAFDIDYEENKSLLRDEMGSVHDQSLLKMRDAEIQTISKELGPDRFKKVFNTIYDYARLTGGSEEEKKDLVSEEKPPVKGTSTNDPSKLPTGPGGAAPALPPGGGGSGPGEDLEEAASDSAEPEEEIDTNADEANAGKKSNQKDKYKKLFGSLGESQNRMNTEVRKNSNNIVKYFETKAEMTKRNKFKVINGQIVFKEKINKGIFKKGSVREKDLWYKQIFVRSTLDTFSKQAIMTEDSNIKTFFTREGRAFVSNLVTAYKNGERTVPISKYEEYLITGIRKASFSSEKSYHTRILSTVRSNLSMLYDQADVILKELSTAQKLEIKSTFDSIIKSTDKKTKAAWDKAKTTAIEYVEKQRLLAKKSKSADMIHLLLVRGDDEVNQHKVVEGLKGRWNDVYKVFIQPLRETTVDIITSSKEKLISKILELNDQVNSKTKKSKKI